MMTHKIFKIFSVAAIGLASFSVQANIVLPPTGFLARYDSVVKDASGKDQYAEHCLIAKAQKSVFYRKYDLDKKTMSSKTAAVDSNRYAELKQSVVAIDYNDDRYENYGCDKNYESVTLDPWVFLYKATPCSRREIGNSPASQAIVDEVKALCKIAADQP